MPGGPWTPSAPPTRPGLYINFISDAIAGITTGQRGRVAMIVRSDWGTANAAQVVDSYAELVNYIGTNETAPNNAYYAARQAFLGGARVVRIYRIMGTGNAIATGKLQDTNAAPVDLIRLDAKNAGVKGNTIAVTTRVNPGDSTKTDIMTYLGGTLLNTKTSIVNRGAAGHIQNLCDLINNDENNYILTATKLGDGNNIPASTTITLAGGNDGS